jgi:hypothetical protein
MSKSLAIDTSEKQEHFSTLFQKIILSEAEKPLNEKPVSSYHELRGWVEKEFWTKVSKTDPLHFVNNQIIIDGQFLHYCDLNKVKVSSLFTESILSWNSEHDFERFSAQGVFKITLGKLSFLTFALFHKGNNYDDEISFGVLVPKDQIDEYVKFRNEYDAWSDLRSRDNQYIYVVGGEQIEYQRNSSWKDIFLEEDKKQEIISYVETFLNSQDFYVKNKIPWKTGLLLSGEPGNGKTTIIRTIISNYNFKPVTITPDANDGMIREAFSYAEENSPSLLYFEDLDSFLEKRDTSTFLNLMDGVATRNGLMVIATANDLSKLKNNVIERPSRFDRKISIDIPSKPLTVKYLTHWFSAILKKDQIVKIADKCVKNKFSYAYLKEIYVSSMFTAIANKKQKPTYTEVENVITRILKEKKTLHQTVSIDDYLV